MRHFRSILYALVLAPAVWVLAAVGLTHDLTTRGRDDFAVESITGLSLLMLAGAAYAILVFAPISPAGPTFAGLAYLGVAIWALRAPSAYADVWPPGVAKEGFDLSRPGYGLAALLAVPLIGTALSARRWARYEPPVLPIIGQIGRARGTAPVAGTPIAGVDTALLPGHRTDPDPTTVLRLPQPNGAATLVASSGVDTTVIHTDATVAFSNDPTIVVDEEKTAAVVSGDAETAVIDEREKDEPTADVPESASAALAEKAADAEESSKSQATQPDSKAPSEPESGASSQPEPKASSEPFADHASASRPGPSAEAQADEASKPDTDTDSNRTPQPDSDSETREAADARAADARAADARAAEGSADDEPTVVTPAGSRTPPSEDETPAETPPSEDETPAETTPGEDETTRTLDLVNSETTATPAAPDTEVTRPIPFPRAVPAAETVDDAEEPTRPLRAVDSDRARDLRKNASDEERTEVIRLPVGDQAEKTQVVRLPQPSGPVVYRTGEQTRIIPFPGAGDAGGDETQIIRLPVRSNEGENTQVIRPSLVEPPPERTEVIQLPLRRTDDADETVEQPNPARTETADGPGSIAEAEAPDIGDDPTSRLEPTKPRTDEDARRSMTVMKMERPPEN